MKSQDYRYLLFPSTRTGNGTGHLRRCFRLSRALGPDALVVLHEADTPGHFSREQLQRLLSLETAEVPVVYALPSEGGVTILDNRETDEKLFSGLLSRGPVIALDEGGSPRRRASLVLDTLPRLDGDDAANLRSPGLLDLPNPVSAVQRGVLVTFGGEDPAHLTEKMVRALVPEFYPPEAVTVIRPALAEAPKLPAGMMLLEPRSDIKEHLGEYELVCCSFGLTAYEACAAGTAVLLFNPSRYHSRLSRAAGFPEAGVKNLKAGRIGRFLSRPEDLLRRCSALVPKERLSLAEAISRYDFTAPRGCPVCGRLDNPAVARLPSATFFRCNACSLVYREEYSGRKENYQGDYFFKEYRDHYGKTYLEDFNQIAAMASPRLRIIQKLLPKGNGRPRLLDVGCAYGPFLKEAAAAGFDCRGIDLSDDAAAHVTRDLGIPAQAVSFEDFVENPTESDRFDVITLWFVIEHFHDLSRVLEKVHRLLVPGGVLAFSTPNLHGISGRKNLPAFLKASPEDHRSVFSPASAKKVLEGRGLSLARIRITGHHPERFPSQGALRLPEGAYAAVSRLFHLGDTFEAYAVKTGSP